MAQDDYIEANDYLEQRKQKVNSIEQDANFPYYRSLKELTANLFSLPYNHQEKPEMAMLVHYVSNYFDNEMIKTKLTLCEAYDITSQEFHAMFYKDLE